MNVMRQYSVAFLFICALAQGIWVGGQIHRLGTPGCQAGFKAISIENLCNCGTHDAAGRAAQPQLSSTDAGKYCAICQAPQTHADVPQSANQTVDTIQVEFSQPIFTLQHRVTAVDTLHAGRAPPVA